MKLHEFYTVNNYYLLTEAEHKEKESELFSYLSNEDLDVLDQELSESLQEENLLEIDPRNKNAYKPKGDKLAGGIHARYPHLKPEQLNRTREISATVKSMPEKEKAALIKKVKQEKKKRASSPAAKVAAPKKSGSLKKVIKTLGALALVGAIGTAGLGAYVDNLDSNAAAQQAAAQAAQDAELAKTPEQKEIDKLKKSTQSASRHAKGFAMFVARNSGWDVDTFGHDIAGGSMSDFMKLNALQKDGRKLEDLEGIKLGNGYFNVSVDVEGPKDVTVVVGFTNYKVNVVKINGQKIDVSRYNWDIRKGVL